MLVGKLKNTEEWVVQLANNLAGRDEALIGFAIFENGDDVEDRTEEMDLAVKGIAGKYFTFHFTRTGSELKALAADAEVEDSEVYTLIFA